MKKVWSDGHKYLTEEYFQSQFSPIWGNQLFTPGRADSVIKDWASKGVKYITVRIPNRGKKQFRR